MGRPDEDLSADDTTLRLNPDYVEAHSNKAFALHFCRPWDRGGPPSAGGALAAGRCVGVLQSGRYCPGRLTLRGSTWVGRISESILSTAGLSDLVAGSPADYIALAAELAADRDRRSALHASLRSRL
jgi:hypothetical protein